MTAADDDHSSDSHDQMPPSPPISDAFDDFITVGVPTITTLLDSFNDHLENQDPMLDLILFGIIGRYAHSIRMFSVRHGYTPETCHQLAIMEVMADPRVSMMVAKTSQAIVESNFGVGDDVVSV